MNGYTNSTRRFSCARRHVHDRRNYLIQIKKDGAATRIRTEDPLITNEVLYQLSYCGPNGAFTLLTPYFLPTAIAKRLSLLRFQRLTR